MIEPAAKRWLPSRMPWRRESWSLYTASETEIGDCCCSFAMVRQLTRSSKIEILGEFRVLGSGF